MNFNRTGSVEQRQGADISTGKGKLPPSHPCKGRRHCIPDDMISCNPVVPGTLFSKLQYQVREVHALFIL